MTTNTDARALTRMLKQIIANNRAGGSRKIKAGRAGAVASRRGRKKT
jgi:hypothetical protein